MSHLRCLGEENRSSGRRQTVHFDEGLGIDERDGRFRLLACIDKYGTAKGECVILCASKLLFIEIASEWSPFVAYLNIFERRIM